MGEYARSLLVKLPVTVSCVLLEVAVVVAHTHTHTHVHVCAPTDIHLSIGNRSLFCLFRSFRSFRSHVCLTHFLSLLFAFVLPFYSSLSPTESFSSSFFLCCCPQQPTLTLSSPSTLRLVLKNNAGGGGGGGWLRHHDCRCQSKSTERQMNPMLLL